MWRKKIKATSGLAALLLIGMAGCADLDVANPNAPDAERALASADDVEALIAGAFDSWHKIGWYSGPTMAISAASFEHTAPWANAGMEFLARIPRVPLANVAGGRDVGNVTRAWERAYSAVSAIASGLYSIESGEVDLGADGNLRARAYGKLMQGLAHGSVALLYDSGFVFDEDAACLEEATCGQDLADAPLQGYQDVMTAALGYFGEAATLAGGGSFTVPKTWMSQDVPADELERLAHSWAASFRANVARTPAERAAVDWDKVVADANAGVTTDWDLVGDCITFCDEALYYRNYPNWTMMPMWVIGMSDQSGAYQSWMATPTIDKMPFVTITPDTRFPQGATEAEQLDNDGTLFYVDYGWRRAHSRPDRGTWRWSYYDPLTFLDNTLAWEGSNPMVTVREMKALVAEAAYRSDNMPAVASFVNETRVPAGLNATDAAGLNTSCVPMLPNGDCGDLWEMFKWEKRLETHMMGPLRIGWWMDGRGWGDLMEGTYLQFPTPFREMMLLEQAPYNTGGIGGYSSASVGTYGY